jgi:hypothetical protein
VSSETLEAMRQTIWVAIGHPENYSEGAPNCPGCKAEAALAALLAEVARLEQERDQWIVRYDKVSADLYDSVAALAVAREREQRAVQERNMARRDVGVYYAARVAADSKAAATVGALRSLRGWAYVESLAHGIEMPPNLAAVLDAALTDEPAAALGRQAVDDYRQDLASLAEAQTVASVGQPPAAAALAGPECAVRKPDRLSGSASAAADEPASAPACICGAAHGSWHSPECSAHLKAAYDAAADEPGETPA